MRKKADNKIAIPWYRRNIKIKSFDDTMESQPLSINFPKPPTPNLRQPNPVRQPVTQPVTEPTTEPITEPFPFLNPFPLPKPEGGFQPDNPFKNPFPLPLPSPKDNKPTIPTPNPNPIPQMIDDQQTWIDNFVKQVTIVAAVTNVGTKQIYEFVSSYEFEGKGMADFREDAANEFGMVAATLLTIGILGQQLVSLWGRRATMMFSPPINLDDEFFNEHFGNGNNEFYT